MVFIPHCAEGLEPRNRLRSSDIQPGIRVDAPLSRKHLAVLLHANDGGVGWGWLPGGSLWSLSPMGLRANPRVQNQNILEELHGPVALGRPQEDEPESFSPVFKRMDG